jgi:speckle-type POZ protein
MPERMVVTTTSAISFSFLVATMASRLRPPDTSSRCRAGTVTATHDFEVPNFSLLNGNIGADRSVSSAPFHVGGYNWMIEFYPDGTHHRACFGHAAAAYVTVCDGAVGARARFTLSLVGRDGGASRVWSRRSAGPRTFGWPHPTTWGFRRFFLKPLLRLSRCLGDDGRITIRCEITVLAPHRSEDTSPPPSEMPGHLRRVLRDGTGADVAFRVAGREFRAHRVVLAARSPVFCAQLYGPMAEKDYPGRVIEVVDMEPEVFETLLEFVYTDCFEECSTATTQHLLVAADRYGMDRLKLMCAEKLQRSIDVSNVMATLLLADQHHCQTLKEACLVFLSSPKILRLVIATDEFKQLMATCPLLLTNANPRLCIRPN